jgi:hypothetical protein
LISPAEGQRAFLFYGGNMILKIHSKKHGDFKVLIDDEDYDKIKDYTWRVSKDGNTFYALTHIRINGKFTSVPIHRLIMNAHKGQEVDHINNNGLDNRRSNLRICSHSQNMMNTQLNKNNKSGFKGVSIDKKNKYLSWRAQISINNKKICLGNFVIPEEAHEAYCEASKKYHGEFARTI